MEKNAVQKGPEYFSSGVILSIVLLIIILIFFKEYNLLALSASMLLWFFAAGAQSMAVLFVGIGVFAVFRIQSQESRLKNLYEIFKRWSWENRSELRLDSNPEEWKDGEISEMGRSVLIASVEHMDSVRKEGGEVLALDDLISRMRNKVEEIEFHQNIRHKILETMKVPMVASLISFLLSTVALTMAVELEGKTVGLVFLIAALVGIAFSVSSVYKYIRYSISL